MLAQNLKRRFCLLLIFLFTVSETVFGQKSDHVQGDMLVMIDEGADIQKLIGEFVWFNNVSTGLKVKQQLSSRLNIWLIHFDNVTINENEFLSGIRKSELVSLAQFNHYTQLRNTPNDPNFGSQWNMLNIGQTGGTSGADVRATAGWDLTTGGITASGDTIVIAVDDDGFDLAHEDLKYWKNHFEIPGNSIDDDENGYIDDYDGWNAQSNTGTITTSSHGTHVSGISGAIGNNQIGVAGVNWNVRIMPVQGNSGLEATAVAGYAYILEMRAKYNETDGSKGALVVSTNSSWGVDFGQPSNYPIWCAIYDSLGSYGVLSVAATSNSSNVDVDLQGDMPTACPSDYLVTVTNTDKNDLRKAAFGLTTIDLGAPGTDIISTTPGNLYGLKTGTSMSSPHVAGAAALICALPCSELAADLTNDPAGTALQIKNFILTGVDPNADLTGKTVSGGRLNVYQALLNAAAFYNCNVGIDEIKDSEDKIMVYPNPANGQLTIMLMEEGFPIADISIFNLLGKEVSGLQVSGQGSQVINLDVSSLHPGMYLLNMESGKGELLSKKILISR